MSTFQKTKDPNIYRADTGVYYVRMFRREKKRELFKSLKTDKITDARIIADRLIKAYLGQKSGKVRELVCDAWADFLEMHSNKSQGTQTSMEVQGRKHLMPFFGDMRMDEVDEKAWEAYIKHAQKVTPGRKLFNDRKYLSMLFVVAHKEGKIERRPQFRNPDPQVKAGRYFEREEVDALLQNADGELKLKILMAVTMAMRRGEILGLDWFRTDLKKKVIRLRAEDTKIRKARTFAISESVLDALIARKKDAKSEWVFPSKSNSRARLGEFRKAWATCKRKAGVKGRFHDLRHTFLTNAFKTSLNPALICHYAGLSLEEAQRTYLHFDEEDTRAVAAIAGKL